MKIMIKQKIIQKEGDEEEEDGEEGEEVEEEEK